MRLVFTATNFNVSTEFSSIFACFATYLLFLLFISIIDIHVSYLVYHTSPDASLIRHYHEQRCAWNRVWKFTHISQWKNINKCNLSKLSLSFKEIVAPWKCIPQIHTYTQIHIHLHIHMHSYPHTYPHTYIHTHAYINTHTYKHAHTNTHAYTSIYIH